MFRASYKAFTIIELLVVIVVIGIIAAVSIVAYNGVQARARDVANESNITHILKIAELHRSQEDVYPGVHYGEEDGMNRWDTTVGDYTLEASRPWWAVSWYCKVAIFIL